MLQVTIRNQKMVDEVIKLKSQGLNITEISKAIGASRSTVRACLTKGPAKTFLAQEKTSLIEENLLSFMQEPVEIVTTPKTEAIEIQVTEPIAEVAPDILDKIKSKIVKPVFHNVFEQRLNEIDDLVEKECNKLLEAISNCNYLSCMGQITIKKNALMLAIYKDKDWFIETFNKGWNTLSRNVSTFFKSKGFNIKEEPQYSAIIVKWSLEDE